MVHSAHIFQGHYGDICKRNKNKDSSRIWLLYLIWMFAVHLFLTAVGLCSCRFCRLAWPDTDRSHPPGPGVLSGTEGSWRMMKKKKMKKMRWMVVMKMSAGWPCPSPPQRWREILKGTDTACRHAYGGDGTKQKTHWKHCSLSKK